jgi:hypothetical protein
LRRKCLTIARLVRPDERRRRQPEGRTRELIARRHRGVRAVPSLRFRGHDGHPADLARRRCHDLDRFQRRKEIPSALPAPANIRDELCNGSSRRKADRFDNHAAAPRTDSPAPGILHRNRLPGIYRGLPKVAPEQPEGQPVQPAEVTTTSPVKRQHAADTSLVRAARDLEASFLSVMLREAGLGAPRAALGGGPGEEQFASFLTQVYAERMADRGGIGLAEIILRSLQERAGDAV